MQRWILALALALGGAAACDNGGGKGQGGAEQAALTAEQVVARHLEAKLRKEGTHEGKSFVKLFDGTRGYLADGDKPMEAMPAEKSAKMADYSQFDDALVDYAARGHKVELAGAEDVKGSKAHHLKVTLANGEVEHRYLDATTFLDVKRTVTFKDKEGVQRTRNTYFGDWREVGGLKFNFASESDVDGKAHKVTIQAIEVDAKIDPAKFTAQLANTVAMAQ